MLRRIVNNAKNLFFMVITFYFLTPPNLGLSQHQSKQIIYVILRIFLLFYAKNHHIRPKSNKMRPSSAVFRVAFS